MLHVCSSSTEESFTSLDAVQEVIGAPSTDEPLLDRLITRASRWAETYLGYPLGVQIYAETVPGFGARNLMLSRTPIRGLTRVLDSTATSGASDYSTQCRIEDPLAGFLSRDEGWEWTAVRGQEISDFPIPASETRPWYVTYESGWTFAGRVSTEGGTTSTGRTLPEDIEAGIIEKVIELYERQGNVASKKIGDLSVNYRTESKDGPAERWLAPYRRPA